MTDRVADTRLASAPRDFDFAEACALLGGATGSDERLARGQQWLFAGDARWPLEILRLELCLFLDVCARVAALPATARDPAELAPHAVRVAIGDGSASPVRWRLRAQVPSGGPVGVGTASGGAGASLRALGVLLLQALLVDDAQELGAVTGVFDDCLRGLAAEAAAQRSALPASSARLPQLLAGKELRGCCDAVHLLHRASDRTAVAQMVAADRPLVPPALWSLLLVAAGRALATWPPFAFAAAGEAGDDALAQLVAAVQAVVVRLDDELFHTPERDAAVAAACTEVAEPLRAGTQPRAAAAPTPVPASAPGFRMLVRRDGDAQSQELRYEIERVTIGRREGENLLRLNDPMVSSMHAVIEITPDGWVVLDRNSTNGTEVDGIRLPVEVPQPLEDGSVIVIRPFRLTFHTLVSTQPPKTATPALTAASLRDRLHDVHARERAFGSLRVHEALLAAIADAGAGLPPEVLLRCLDEVARTDAPAASTPAVERPLDVAAARALLQLSRSLLGTAEFSTVEQVQQFAGKLGRFVDATAHWMERMLELRRALGRHLDLGQVSTSGGRAPVRTAADVRALVAGWQSDAPAVDAAAWYVAKFFDDIVAIVVGLLEVNQQVRKAIRERLDPARLADIAGRAAAARVQVQAAMASPLWQEYVQAFAEVTGSAASDAEFAQLLQRVSALQPQRS
jgi:predicted component of type VI protein secretion system